MQEAPAQIPWFHTCFLLDRIADSEAFREPAILDSRWTPTAAACLLRKHGSGVVWPLTLAQAGAGQ